MARRGALAQPATARQRPRFHLNIYTCRKGRRPVATDALVKTTCEELFMRQITVRPIPGNGYCYTDRNSS